MTVKWESILTKIGTLLAGAIAFFLIRKAGESSAPPVDVEAIRKQQESLDAAAAQRSTSQQVVDAEAAKQTQLGQSISGVTAQLQEQPQMVQEMNHDQLQAEFDRLGAASSAASSNSSAGGDATSSAKPVVSK